ncbi:MAG TPA: flagellar assembly protein FliX [Candidatus Sulfotelmatobacter sp.]|nr:flagellar assembly protein FliX [Candidatus Sulfotelmatobacter sp.]
MFNAMKIESPSTTRGVASARKSDKAKGKSDEFARALEEGEEDGAVPGVSAAPVVSAIDALLSVQEMSGDEERSAQAKARGEELLEQLDELRHGLLAGHLSPDRLDGLVALVRSERALATDPRLAETLDEIELRAKVELAKLGREV